MLIHKIIISAILLSLLLTNATRAVSTDKQDNSQGAQTKTEEIQIKIEPKIKAEEFIQVDKKAIFDASDSTILPTGTAKYDWDFGDNTRASGQDVVHQYKRIGKYTISLTISQEDKKQSAQQQVFVYDKKALLIIDEAKEEKINQIKLQAAENGVALKLLSTVKAEGEFMTEDNLVQAITEIGAHVKDANMLIFYTKSALGLQSFTRFWKNITDIDKNIIRNKYLVTITDGSLDVAANFAYQSFKIIKPKYILLTRQEALNPLFTSKDYSQIVNTLQGRGIEYKIIDERGKKSPAFILSGLITQFIAKGVSSSSIYLILIIPFLACLVVFFRQIIGLSTFGIYTPVITAASFYILGVYAGIFTFLFAVIVGYLVKYLMNKFELLYLSKVALNLGLISLSFLIVIWLILLSGSSLSLSVAIFPMLVMSSITEKFMAAQTEEGFRGAVFGVLETLIVVVICYYLITWTSFSNVVMSWPELAIAPLLLILLIGKFSGLRLSEYLRFKSLFAEHTEE